MLRMEKTTVIGVDFDNTIISYDQLVYDIALDRGLINDSIPKNKLSVRDFIRLLPDGEEAWQQLQAEIYGPSIRMATLIPGVRDFFSKCSTLGVRVYIISHKTKYANFDKTNTNLREAAISWMEEQRLFREAGGGLSPHHVIFASTRDEKISLIGQFSCTYFVDDLVEVFNEEKFPTSTKKILFNPDKNRTTSSMNSFSSWPAILDHIFGKH